MLPRQVRRIGEVERAVIHERYMEIMSGIWDMIANDIVRHERFRDIPGIFPANVQELYANVGNRRAARRILRDFIAREQRE